MPPVESLAPAVRAAVADHAALCKHDLGKYVAMQTRWTDVAAGFEERRAAVVIDLSQTRRGPDGNTDAVEVWRVLRPPLCGLAPLGDGSVVDLADDPDVAAIDAAMSAIAQMLPRLSGADADEVTRAADAAVAVSDACQRLFRRAKGR